MTSEEFRDLCLYGAWLWLMRMCGIMQNPASAGVDDFLLPWRMMGWKLQPRCGRWIMGRDWFGGDIQTDDVRWDSFWWTCASGMENMGSSRGE